jgi:hypothetical protein
LRWAHSWTLRQRTEILCCIIFRSTLNEENYQLYTVELNMSKLTSFLLAGTVGKQTCELDGHGSHGEQDEVEQTGAQFGIFHLKFRRA